MRELTHLNNNGEAHMVDIADKPTTSREAVARGEIQMKPETLQLIQEGRMGKGDVFAVARIAGIMAAKKTSDIIPLCHPLQISSVGISFEIQPNRILIDARVRSTGRTGVEMEALTAVSAAALTLYDMAKCIDKDMVIGSIRLEEKSGGKSGTYMRTGS